MARANQAGARCLVLPAIPFGNDNQQLTQAATITMRSAMQLAVLRDIAESLVRHRPSAVGPGQVRCRGTSYWWTEVTEWLRQYRPNFSDAQLLQELRRHHTL